MIAPIIFLFFLFIAHKIIIIMLNHVLRICLVGWNNHENKPLQRAYHRELQFLTLQIKATPKWNIKYVTELKWLWDFSIESPHEHQTRGHFTWAHSFHQVFSIWLMCSKACTYTLHIWSRCIQHAQYHNAVPVTTYEIAVSDSARVSWVPGKLRNWVFNIGQKQNPKGRVENCR